MGANFEKFFRGSLMIQIWLAIVFSWRNNILYGQIAVQQFWIQGKLQDNINYSLCPNPGSLYNPGGKGIKYINGKTEIKSRIIKDYL